MEVSITNTGERNMPMGFGIHPYFHALLAPDSEATQAMITVPAAKYWELDEALVPTGKTFSASGALDLRNGQPYANAELDHVFTDVQLTDGISRCIIDNRDTGVARFWNRTPSSGSWLSIRHRDDLLSVLNRTPARQTLST